MSIDVAKLKILQGQAIDAIEKAMAPEITQLTEEEFHAESIRVNCAFNLLQIPSFMFEPGDGTAGEPAITDPAPTDQPPALATA